MAPCRQLLMWSVPSIAVLLGIFWFKKKREYAKSDPGGRERIKSLKEELAEVLNTEAEISMASPICKIERSIVKSAPIDIIPNGSGSQRSSPLELTDEEVDLEIEKIIRRKSLEKEKKMSMSAENKFKEICSSSAVTIVKDSKSDLIYPSFKTELKCMNNGNTNSEVDNADENEVEAENISINTEADTSLPDSTKSEAVVSDDNVTEENNLGVNEELHVNNNIVEASSNSNELSNNDRFSTSQNRRISERDSANHSPVDPLLASPSMCHFSDNHSEVSIVIYLFSFSNKRIK